MIPELERWKRFPQPWSHLGPHMAEVLRAVARGEPEPMTPYRAQRQYERKPGQYRRQPPAPGFSGQALRQLREAARFSQSGLAYLVGTTQGRVSEWELNLSSPSAGNLELLVKVLECLPSELMCGKS